MHSLLAHTTHGLARLAIRQADATTPENGSDTGADAPVTCENGNEYDGRMGLRIASVFVILVGSMLGAFFPVLAKRWMRNSRLMEHVFFFAKYFGSGVIIATAFIHLLAPSADALSNDCLTGPITEYDWTFGIALMMVFTMFFVELITMRLTSHSHTHEHGHAHGHANGHADVHDLKDIESQKKLNADLPAEGHRSSFIRGDDHLGHAREHVGGAEPSGHNHVQPTQLSESQAAQLTGMFVLEFGVLFHSVLIGLTLAVTGSDFITLFIVITFHQTFEGLGLGTRLAEAPFKSESTKYWLALAYGLVTPVAIAAGLGARKTYDPNTPTALIVSGVFDALSAGILIYTGLVELMAHEFMFSPSMRNAPLKTILLAFLQMCLGAGLMALLGKWA